jgi:hypothetical protein
MPLSQKFKYNEADAKSFFEANKKIAFHPFVSSDAHFIVPLRGAFIPAACLYSHRKELDRKQFTFIPASGFIMDFGQVVRRSLRNYLQEKLKKARAPLSIVLLDEAKSGRAAYTLYKKFKEVQEDLARRDAEEQVNKIFNEKKLDEIGELKKKAEKKIQFEQKEEENSLKQILNEENLKLVEQNGDFTPAGAALFAALKKYGFIEYEDAENLFSHRLLVEQKLAAALNPRFKGSMTLSGEEGARVLSRTKARLDKPLHAPQNLKQIFPLLEPYYVEKFDDIKNKELVNFHAHVQPNPETHPRITANKSVYEAAFATLANYRLNVLLEAVRKASGRSQFGPQVIERVVKRLIEASRDKAEEEKQAMQYYLAFLRNEIANQFAKKKPNQQELEKLKQLIRLVAHRNSKYNSCVRFKLIGLHGIDNFVTTLGYAKLKDEGVASQVDSNKIITMDNPTTPITYEKTESGRYSYKPIYSPSNEFRVLHAFASKYGHTARFTEFLKNLQQRMARDAAYAKPSQRK